MRSGAWRWDGSAGWCWLAPVAAVIAPGRGEPRTRREDRLRALRRARPAGVRRPRRPAEGSRPTHERDKVGAIVEDGACGVSHGLIRGVRDHLTRSRRAEPAGKR